MKKLFLPLFLLTVVGSAYGMEGKRTKKNKIKKKKPKKVLETETFEEKIAREKQEGLDRKKEQGVFTFKQAVLLFEAHDRGLILKKYGYTKVRPQEFQKWGSAINRRAAVIAVESEGLAYKGNYDTRRATQKDIEIAKQQAHLLKDALKYLTLVTQHPKYISDTYVDKVNSFVGGRVIMLQ